MLIEATAEETRILAWIGLKSRWLSRLYVIGALLSGYLVRVTSGALYLKPASRHARSCGCVPLLMLFQPASDTFGAAHTVDLPLLLDTQASWRATPLLANADWEQMHQTSQQVRADFARTGGLPTQGHIPCVLRSKHA